MESWIDRLQVTFRRRFHTQTEYVCMNWKICSVIINSNGTKWLRWQSLCSGVLLSTLVFVQRSCVFHKERGIRALNKPPQRPHYIHNNMFAAEFHLASTVLISWKQGDTALHTENPSGYLQLKYFSRLQGLACRYVLLFTRTYVMIPSMLF